MTDIHVVDAFTDVMFRGNPAGVVILREERSAAWMRSVAAEMRHSETAFVLLPEGTGGADGAGVRGPVPLRWFTPTSEVDLCGHATLAATHVLGGTVEFSTRASGPLHCRAEGGWIDMDFPADELTTVGEVPAGLRGCFAEPLAVEAVVRGRDDLLVQVAEEFQVRSLVPDFDALVALSRSLGLRGVVITARGGGDTAFVSRCFYPAVGVPEDPVTGSAHCTLATWWSPSLGGGELMAEQASERGGRLRLSLVGDRVRLGGRAVSVLSGTLHA
ncbi:PhzF family phenazine biosynthesis protein [Streptomyces sp. J2-1]|uniref:PhzF family phenazine biosynthesis protein n=1 Tax=Streptomyces corallincola TaxID=2851888 RepID=UPI001C38874C|nr:PhzF family phenazine biosynthesis protein [Streptomyces corallincola]MBV2354788.1 PhzF family phenazine biosynthesis protein [Streptomyces corallincola]